MDKERLATHRHTGYLALLMGTLLLASFIPPSASAKDPARIIGWEDLKVTVEFEDPFEALTPEQLMKLSIYARIQEMLDSRPTTVSEGMAREAEEAKALLREQGVDVEGLLARREEITQLRMKRESARDERLDGVAIRMPGFALALEYDGKKITEFLLVPWVGACIHTPPPPANQIVYVKAEDGFEMSSRFEPVWVEGTMGVGTAKKQLFLIDGSADIDIGYSMTEASIEKYTSAPKPEIRPATH